VPAFAVRGGEAIVSGILSTGSLVRHMEQDS
jgi:hypothetical protein